MCHGDIDFEAYEIDRAFQIFKLVSLTAKKVQSLPLFGISAYGKSQVMNLESFFGELKRPNVYDISLDTPPKLKQNL
jgi:hypothetical protein